ncbi:MAG: SWIM zinc finger family protein [Dehalococcoidia bacterium]
MTTATIPSRTSSQQYTVCLADDGMASCTCTADSLGKPCWHVRAIKAEAERRQTAELARSTPRSTR